ncbi:hypothetical protein GP486_006292 [Trichoglossum hirsutum]|uniref:Uncharacterized protein n=1 Tax=Trichoglossum hirsutum TaxID=265104 RepID=A0A9P8IDY5_9PEZI|nr:hypothetical protein GP486_006292 [Trichoglossum hirsutum]
MGLDDPPDPKSDSLGLSSTWSSGWNPGSWGFPSILSGSGGANGTKAGGGDSFWGSDKKNKKDMSFGFSYDHALGGGELGGLGDAGAETQQGNTDSAWNAPLTKGGKKKANRKGGNFADDPLELNDDTVTAEPETAPTGAEPWSTWETTGSKKNKKNKKNAAADEKKDELASSISPPAQDKDPDAVLGSEWGVSSGRKDKKKKNGLLEDKDDVPPKGGESQIVETSHAATGEDSWNDDWATTLSKKDKKSKKKGVFGDLDDPSALEEEKSKPPTPIPEPEPPATEAFSWGKGGSKKDKKKKKGTVEKDNPAPQQTEEPVAIAEHELDHTAGESTWNTWETFPSKKDKKNKKKGIVADEDPVPQQNEESQAVVEPGLEHGQLTAGGIGWNTWEPTPKKGKGNRKKSVVETVDPTPVQENHEPIIDPASVATGDIGWGEWGALSKRDKKNKKGVAEEKKEQPAPAEEKRKSMVASELGDDTGWTGWGTTSLKDKKGKKGSAEGKESAAADEKRKSITEPDAFEASSSIWSTTSKKGKKGKKGITEENDSAPVEEKRKSIFELDPTDEFGLGGLGPTSRKDKKGKKGPPEEKESAAAEEQRKLMLDLEFADEISLGGWENSSKKDKKSKKGVTGEKNEAATAELEPTEDTSWKDWTALSSKKDKKNKKGVTEEKDFTPVEEKRESIAEFKSTEDASWNEWPTSSSKRDKKNKKKNLVEEGESAPAPEEEKDSLLLDLDLGPAAATEKSWSTWDTPSSKKKGKKGSTVETKTGPAEVAPDASTVISAAAETATTMTDVSWESGKKGKAGKKGRKSEPPPPPAASIPPVPPLPESAAGTKGGGFDNGFSWGKGRAKKRDSIIELPPDTPTKEPIMSPHAIDELNGDAAESFWDDDGWGLSGKKKNTKKNVVEVVENTPAHMQPDDIVEPKATELAEEEDAWPLRGKKDKKKGKKGKNAPDAPPPAPSAPAQDVVPPPPPPIPSEPAVPEVPEDEWERALVKPKGKKGAKKAITSKAEDTPKVGDMVTKFNSVDDTTQVTGQSKQGNSRTVDGSGPLEIPKKDTAAKATKSIWGSFGSTATKANSKTKPKDKAPEPEPEPEPMQDDVIDIVEPPPSKSSKAKAKNGSASASALSKVESSKSSKAGKTGKNVGKAAGDPEAFVAVAVAGVVDAEPPASPSVMEGEEKRPAENDVWSFWGASKKTKKPAEAKKAPVSPAANRELPPIDPTIASMIDSDITPPPPTRSTKKQDAAKGKTAATIQKFEAPRSDAFVLEPAPEPEPAPKAAPVPKRTVSASKAKGSIKKKEAARKEDPIEAVPESEPVSELVSLPGSFPSETMNGLAGTTEATPAKPAKNGKKGRKAMADAASNPGPKSKLDSEGARAQPPLQAPIEPPSPPTPSPVELDPPKPVKQRARIVRDNNDMAWGFWGAPKKKEVKPKEAVAAVAVAAAAPPEASSPPKVKNGGAGLTRAKSTKKPVENEAEKSSSSSDKASQPETRPSTSEKPSEKPRKTSQPRKMSLLELLSGPPPSKSKMQRRTSAANAGSRRQSLPIEEPSPAPPYGTAYGAPEMSSKAAKLLGATPQKDIALARRESKRKSKIPVVENIRAPIDDDMVIVDPPVDEQVIDIPPRREVSSRGVRASRGAGIREIKQAPAEPVSPEVDDVVVVDPPGHNDAAMNERTLAFETPLQSTGRTRRSSSTPKKPDKLLSIFGSFRSKKPSREPEYETQHKNRASTYESDDGAKRRSQHSAPENDDRRLRRDKREVRRSVVLESDDAEAVAAYGNATGAVNVDVEDYDARKEERRRRKAAKEAADREAREAEQREAEAREARRRELEQRELEARKARAKEARERKSREDEARIREEKRARRAAREQAAVEERARKIAEEQEAQRHEERRARRAARERERQASQGAAIPVRDAEDRPSKYRNSERRRSHAEPRNPQEEEERRARKEERRAHRASKEIRSSRRQSAPPVTDYSDPRDGRDAYRPEVEHHPAGGPVYNATQPLPAHANDHTSSWVNSQIIEPAPPPPAAPTVVDGANTHIGYDDSPTSDEARREQRRARRESKYASMSPEEIERRRRKKESRRAERDVTFKSSDGSNPSDPYHRSKRSSQRMSSHGYAEGVKTFDGRSAGAHALGKSSWWKGILG